MYIKFCLCLLLSYAAILIEEIWFDLISNVVFLKISLTYYVVFIVSLLIYLIKDYRKTSKLNKEKGYVD